MRRNTLLLALLAAPAGLWAQEDDPQLAFNNHCRTCHSQEEGDNRLGPSLHGILGREVGSLADYDYSDAMARADFTWEADRLDAFLADPDGVLPGHAMRPYPGISDPALRASILAALGAEGSKPVAKGERPEAGD